MEFYLEGDIIEIEINNKKFSVEIGLDDKNNTIFIFPLLLSIDKLDRKNFWKIYVKENEIFRFSWIENGKVKEFPPYETTGKNIGKSNETTDNDQALLEAYASWTKKIEKNYHITGEDDDEEYKNEELRNKQWLFKPQLAQKYEERGKKYLKLPFCGSRKFDGVRGVFQLYSPVKGEIKTSLTSRNKKEFYFMDNFKNQLANTLLSSGYQKWIIDGEIYSHDLPFNVISGVSRNKNRPSEFDSRIGYYVFDVINPDNVNMPYSERMEAMRNIEFEYKKLFPNKSERRIYFEYCEIIHNHNEVQKLHDKYVSEGYEGLMLRNLDGKYMFDYRTNDLQKYKNFQDDEFVIIGSKQGVSTEKGAIIFIVETQDGSRFDVRPRGSVERRREMYEEKNSYVGKMLTVRYQNIDSESGIPRFPIGIDVRDYE